jgi:TIGR03009 family protein
VSLEGMSMTKLKMTVGVILAAGFLTSLALADAPAPKQDRLDEVLLRWEQATQRIGSLLANCRRTDDNKTFQIVKTRDGTLKYMKPNLFALELQEKKRPDEFEKYVFTEQLFYVYAPQRHEIMAGTLPLTDWLGEVVVFHRSFLLGMTAEEAKRRYHFTLAKEDEHYVYLDFTPGPVTTKHRFLWWWVEDALFRRGRLVLSKGTFLTRQVWYEQANGDTVTWDLSNVVTDLPLVEQEFTIVDVPQGWKLTTVSWQDSPHDEP